MSTPESHIPEIPSFPPSPPALEPIAPRPPDENPPWNFWDAVALGVLTYLLSFGFGLGLGYLVHRRFTPNLPFLESLKRPEVIVAGQLLGYVAVLILMYQMVYSRSGGQVLHALRWNWPEKWLPYLLGGVALELCLVPLEHILPMPKHAPIEDFFRTARDAWVLSVFGLLIAPLFEELLFRGFIYPALARRLGMPISIVLTSVLFAAVHAPQLGFAWGAVSVIFLVGLALTTVRAIRKSLGATILVHTAYNGTVFFFLCVATSGFRHLEKMNQ